MKHKPREQPFRQPPQGRRGWWRWTGFANKTFWDWLQLLLVPAMLALVGSLLAAAQENIQQQAEESRAQDAQDEALQTYIEGMGNLVLDEGLLTSQEDEEVRTLARARTLTVLGQVDGARKRSVVQFLYEAQLIQKDKPIVPLSGADLTDADLSGADLRGANLRVADLRGAYLSRAVLFGADLSDAVLFDADLSDARLSGADLSGIRGFTPEELEAAAFSLSGATMPDGSTYP
jgi:uncharacterized protein YjbI with pentapeptide repeats